MRRHQKSILFILLHILGAQHGSIGFIPELMAVYKIHSNSTYSSRKVSDNLKSVIKFYEVINSHLEYKYGQLIQKMIEYYKNVLRTYE